jgi:hypothetical protein
MKEEKHHRGFYTECPKNGVLMVHYGVEEITITSEKCKKNSIGLIC